MTRSLLLAALLSSVSSSLLSFSAAAQAPVVVGAEDVVVEPAVAPAIAAEAVPAAVVVEATPTRPARVVDETSLEDHRTALQALNEHFLGSASRPVRFDWRKSNFALVLRVAEVLERNSFGQWQIGAMGRKAFGDVIVDAGLNAFFAYETPSSQQLALTPFRQAGRPNHFQLEANVGYAVAEGVVTPMVSILPPAELALVAWAGARYLMYVDTFTGSSSFTDVAASLASPRLTEGEIIRLERSGPAGMQIDPARLHGLVGASLDVYLQPGVLVAPRVMVALPLLAPATGTQLGFFWELSIAVGYAF